MENKPEENSLEDVLRWMDEDIDHAFERVLNPLEYGENEDATLIWQVVKDSERLLKQYSLQCAEMKEELERLRQENERLKSPIDEARRECYHKLKAQKELHSKDIEQLQEEVERLTKVLKYCQSKAYTIVNTKNAINHKYVKSDAVKMKDAIDAALSSKESKPS